MKTLYITIFITSLLALAIGCKHSTTPQPTPAAQPPDTTNTGGGGGTGGGGTTNPNDTALCFERDILPIFRSNCAKSGCHDAITAEEGFIFTDYANIVAHDFEPGDADDCELYEKITDNDPDDRMPPPPNARLTQQQIGLIRRWINEGAKNTGNCATLCDTTLYTYSGAILPLITNNCKGCHSTAAAPKGIALDTYAGVQSAALSGRLLAAIQHQPGVTPMPFNGPKLDDCRIKQVEKWIAAGAPEN